MQLEVSGKVTAAYPVISSSSCDGEIMSRSYHARFDLHLQMLLPTALPASPL